MTNHEGSIRRPIAPRTDARTTELHLAPLLRYLNVNLMLQTWLNTVLQIIVVSRECHYSSTHIVTTTIKRRKVVQRTLEDKGHLCTKCVSGTEREMFYLTMHSTHFIYGSMASDIWLRTILIVRKETRCRHIGYCYRLTARVLL